MKLLLRRDQHTGGIVRSKVTFSLIVRADLSDEERHHIKKYRLGDTILYTRGELVQGSGSGLLGVASKLAFKAMNISVSVDDLTNGKRVDCKDIMEMLGVEEQIKTAAATFKAVLDAAARFGGDEVLDL